MAQFLRCCIVPRYYLFISVFFCMIFFSRPPLKVILAPVNTNLSLISCTIKHIKHLHLSYELQGSGDQQPDTSIEYQVSRHKTEGSYNRKIQHPIIPGSFQPPPSERQQAISSIKRLSTLSILRYKQGVYSFGITKNESQSECCTILFLVGVILFCFKNLLKFCCNFYSFSLDL